MRRGLILNLGTGSGPGSLFLSHRIKGRWDPCIFTSCSQCCLAQCPEHTRTGDPHAQSHRAQFASLPRVSHLFQVAVGWEMSYNITARRPLKGDVPKGQRSAGDPKATDTSSNALFLVPHWVPQQTNIILWVEAACSCKTELFGVQIRFMVRKHQHQE